MLRQIPQARRGALALTSAGVLAAALVLSGCSGSSSSDGASTSASSSTGIAQATVALEAKVIGLDPNKVTDGVSLHVLHLIAGTLTEYKPGNQTGIQPGLATSWQASADGKGLTVKLFSGETFSDGTPLTAKDVAASFDYFLKDKANVNSGQLQPISSVTATDDSTVEFALKSAYPSLPSVLAMPNFMIMPAASLNGADFMKNPISAGPYSLQSWGGGDTVGLARNEHYHGAQPVVDKLKFVTVSDSASRESQLRAGQIDVAANLPPTSITDLSGVADVTTATLNGGEYLGMNDRTGLLSNVAVRQAISKAVDREEISRITFGGKAKPMDDFFPSSMQWHKSSYSITPDVAAAKQLLTGTPCASGCSLTMMMRNADNQAIQQAAVIIQKELKPLGIDIKIDLVDKSVWNSALGDGTFDMTIITLSDYVDIPDGLLTWGLISDGGVSALFSGYKSPEMDAAAKKVIGSDGAQRQTSMDEVHRIFAQDMPYVPLIDLQQVTASKLAKGTIYLAPSGFLDVARK